MGPERFLLEIKLTARLQHPHILPLLDSGILEPAPGRSAPYYVMPYVEGESLRSRLNRERQLPVDDAVRLAGDVAAALAYAHSRGIIHRDIKPENILISNGQAIVADFGIARAVSLAGGERLTGTGIALGTPHYMSPEQATGDREVDARADVYALGVVLYEMLAGEPPFSGPTAQAVVARSLTEPAPPIRKARGTVSAGIEQVIARALAKLPADRFAGAAEFGEALSRADSAPEARTARPTRVGRRGGIAAAAIGVVLLSATAALLLRGIAAPAIIAPASSIAVLPFTPSGPDTALSRLGRDLVFTLSATLDGLGGISVVDAHTVLAGVPREGFTTASGGAALARRFGAAGVVQGSLVRVGPAVRLDLALYGSDSAGAAHARATVTAPPDSIAALTDSAARALLAQVWSRGTPPTPSLDGALRTRSVPALRAFLQGERELTQGMWDEAATSYERAMGTDASFWLAYARHVFARYWSVDPAADSVIVALERHRFELPERERLSSEAILLEAHDSIGLGVERARAAAVGDPDSWFGWLLYGDAALHNGPLLGLSQQESRNALEHAVGLNPDLIPAWEHLMLAALRGDDTAAAGRALHQLDRLDAGPTLSADGYGNRMQQFRYLYAIQRGDTALVRVLTDSMALDVVGSFYDPFLYGFFAEQMDVSRAALAANVAPERRRAHRQLLALSWAGRGAWDSALAGFDRLGDGGADSVAPLRAYGMATLAVWLGAADRREARARRPAAIRAARGTGAGGGAEIAWLDGVLAAADSNRRELTAAREALRKSGDTGWRALDRSLGALDTALQGATGPAGEAMATLEWEEAAVAAPDFAEHPLVIPLDRLAGARWLAANDDTEQAQRLLEWVEAAYGFHPSTLYSLALAGLADLERARIEEGLGQPELARRYYLRFLRRYDRPVPHHLPLVEEARAQVSATQE
jgi:serine/threonine-protein kinase